MEQSPSRSILRIPSQLITPQTDDHLSWKEEKIKVKKTATTSKHLKKERLISPTQTQTIKKRRLCEVSQKQHARQVRRNEKKLEAQSA